MFILGCLIQWKRTTSIFDLGTYHVNLIWGDFDVGCGLKVMPC